MVIVLVTVFMVGAAAPAGTDIAIPAATTAAPQTSPMVFVRAFILSLLADCEPGARSPSANRVIVSARARPARHFKRKAGSFDTNQWSDMDRSGNPSSHTRLVVAGQFMDHPDPIGRRNLSCGSRPAQQLGRDSSRVVIVG
ncbi:hypothetical protein [Streptomyces rubiginosohelvolus]|uniref:hypothetical protein n=1 Tax=Streptomyces rubiginosohelvolus TaxID=67362 RepID=UPI0037B81E15